MLGVGWTEMLVIGVVALIFIGPKELPALMQKLGKFAGTVRRMGQDFQRELNKTTGLDEVKNLRTAITQPLKSTTDAIRKEFNTTTSSGSVKPSGALKPTDPKAESVVDEIHKAAGLPKPAEPVKGAVMKAAEPVTAMEPIKAAEPVKAAAATTAAAAAAPSKFTPEIITPSSASPPVPETRPKPKRARKAAPKKAANGSAAPAEGAAAKKPRAAKAVDSPAPAEAMPPAQPARKRKPAAKKTT